MEDLLINREIQKALLECEMGRPEKYLSLLKKTEDNAILKSKIGHYVNNRENRRLSIVGQPYKQSLREDEKPELNQRHTSDLYSVDGVWSKARQTKVHEPIVEKYLSKIVKESKPRAILMLGGPASGKGFYLDKLIEQDSSLKDLPILDIDEIRVNDIPEYKEIHKIDAKLAANYVQNESSYLGNKIEKKYIQLRSSFIRDAVFGDFEKLKETVRELKKVGYEISLIGVAADFKIALQRRDKRFQTKGRWVGDDIVRKGHKGASDTFDKVINGSFKSEFKNIRLYDGNSDKDVIYDNKVLNQKELDRFLKKKDL